VSQQLTALAEATPAEKFAWRPAAGGRSTGEVYMHIVFATFYLLSITAPKMPADLKRGATANFSQYSDAPFASTQEGCSAPPAKSPETGNGKNASCTGLLVAWTAGCYPLASFSTAPEIGTPLPASGGTAAQGTVFEIKP
jgi:hypothetical protein